MLKDELLHSNQNFIQDEVSRDISQPQLIKIQVSSSRILNFKCEFIITASQNRYQPTRTKKKILEEKNKIIIIKKKKKKAGEEDPQIPSILCQKSCIKMFTAKGP